MVAGARIRVLPVIKDGLPAAFGGSEVKPYLLMTDTAGSALTNGWEIRSGTVLTIVDGPRRRQGINTIVVRLEDGQEGHVFWCEARVSCEIIAPKAVRYDKDAYRIELDGEIVAMALRMANDSWALFDTSDKRIGGRSWPKPADVAKAYAGILAQAGAPTRPPRDGHPSARTPQMTKKTNLALALLLASAGCDRDDARRDTRPQAPLQGLRLDPKDQNAQVTRRLSVQGQWVGAPDKDRQGKWVVLDVAGTSEYTIDLKGSDGGGEAIHASGRGKLAWTPEGLLKGEGDADRALSEYAEWTAGFPGKDVMIVRTAKGDEELRRRP